MPAYRRRGTYSSRRRRYTYRRRYPARRTYRRAFRYIPRPINASSRSRVSVMFRNDSRLTLQVPNGSNISEMAYMAPMVDNISVAPLGTLLRQSILTNPLYTIYRGLYEQVKVDRVVWYITGMTSIGANGDQPALRVMSAIDRDFQQRDLNLANRWSANDILNSSTGVDRVYTNNSKVKLARYAIASDMAERSSWVDTDLGNVGMTAATTGLPSDQTFRAPYTWSSNGGVFCPMLALICSIPDNNTTGNPIPIRFFIQTIVTLSFRNPKGVAQSEAKKAQEEAQKLQTEMAATQEPINWQEFEQPDPVNIT